MSITASSQSKATADFDGNKAGGIEVWAWSGVESQTSTQTTIRYIWGFDQDQTYSDNQDFDAWLDGDNVYSATLTNNKGSDSWQYYTTTRTYNRPAYGSAAGTHTGRGRIDGIYNGPTSDTTSHTFDTTVPAKAGTVLGPPGSLAYTNRTSSSISYSWNDPTSSGIGPAPSDFTFQVATDSGFTNLVYNSDIGNVNSKTITGLNRATTYYARVRAQNSVGYGSWSSTLAVTTLATVPDTPAAPTVSNATSSGFTVAWTAPNNGGSAITSYNIAISDDDFATWVAYSDTVSPLVINDLDPGVKYKARVEAVNAIGDGLYSASSAEIQTLGGVKIWNGTIWGEGIVRVWDGTSWKVCIVRKWNGTAWIV